MSRSVVLFACCMVALSEYAHAGCNTTFHSVRGADGISLALVPTDKDTERGASWLPGGSEPPLSVGRAISVALNYANGHWTQVAAYRVGSVTLHAVPSCAKKWGDKPRWDKWMYVVDLLPATEAGPPSTPHFVGVFMDETVLPPVRVAGDF